VRTDESKSNHEEGHRDELVEHPTAGERTPGVCADGFSDARDVHAVHSYCIDLITCVATRLVPSAASSTAGGSSQQSVRQTVVATAIVYYRRFFANIVDQRGSSGGGGGGDDSSSAQPATFVDFDPRLIAVTALHVACKSEECQVSSRAVLRALGKEIVEGRGALKPSRNADITALADDQIEAAVLLFQDTHINECEFYLLQQLRFDLVTFHPYRPLEQLIADAGLEPEVLQHAWHFVNDSYHTPDVVFAFPPYIIAIGCMQLACTYLQRPARAFGDWFGRINVNKDEVDDVVRTLMKLYRERAEGDARRDAAGTSAAEVKKGLIRRLNAIVPGA
jgi:hypothetical protein